MIRYNKEKKRWYRDDGTQVKLGNRLLGSNGDYFQFNSDGTITKVGSITGGLSKDYINYKKQHKQAINTTLENSAMQSGLVKDKTGLWRLNSVDTKTKLKSVNGKQYFLDKKGVYRNFDNGLTLQQQQNKDKNSINTKVSQLRYGNNGEGIFNKIRNHGLVSGVINSLYDVAGVDKDSLLREGTDIAGNFAYFIPGVGQALSLADAGLAASRGDWTDAGLSLLGGLIPATKGLKATSKILKGLNSTKIGRTERILSKLGRRPALSNRDKTLLQLNRLKATPENIEKVRKITDTHIINNPFNKLSGYNLAGNLLGKNFANKQIATLGDKTIKTANYLGNNWTQPVISSVIDYRRNSKAQDQSKYLYNQQVQNNLNNNIKNGVILGRMSNSDFNNLDILKQKVTPEQYYQARQIIAYN